MQGWGAVCSVKSEGTYGVYASSPTRFLPVRSVTLDGALMYAAPGHLLPAAAAPASSLARDLVKVGERIEGAMEFVPHYDHHSFSILLKHLMASAATSTGSGPYTHTYDLGSTRPGLSVQSIGGFDDSVTDKARRFAGLVCAKWELSVDAQSFVTISSDWIGYSASEMQAIDGTIAVTDTEEIHAAQANASVSWNSLSLVVKSLKLMVDHKMQTSPAVGVMSTTKPVQNDFAEVKISAQVQVRSEAVHDAYIAGDSSDITFGFTGSGNNELNFTAHNCILTKCALVFSGPGEVYYDCEWAARSAALESGLTVALQNDNSAAE